MSGNYVQRGEPAIFDSMVRARAAVLGGADLVLELPAAVSLSSAEGFASGGVRILSGFCDSLCFGSETLSEDQLTAISSTLLSPAFSVLLKEELAKGCSFPAARQAALEKAGISGSSLINPNDILAVEYVKAILSQNSPMQPFPVFRGGNYHASVPDPENPSASSLRERIWSSGTWLDYTPKSVRTYYADAQVFSLAAGERAILTRLRTMSDDEFEALPYGSEGLWRKLMHASRSQSTLEDILTEVKSKRYTRTRLNRMVMCAFLGITANDLATPAPYVRALAFSEQGRQILKHAKKSTNILNAGEPSSLSYWTFERKISDLYGLFARNTLSAPGQFQHRRVIYIKNGER